MRKISFYKLIKELKKVTNNNFATEQNILGEINEGYFYKGCPVSLSYDESISLIITIISNNKDKEKELVEAISSIINDSPLCSYKLQPKGVIKENAFPTVEWFFIDPNIRLMEIFSGKGFIDEPALNDIVVYKETKFSDCHPTSIKRGKSEFEPDTTKLDLNHFNKILNQIMNDDLNGFTKKK